MSKHWKRTLSLLAVAAAVGLVSAGVALGVKPPKPPPEPPPPEPTVAYEITFLGTISVGATDYARDVNNVGEVVGSSLADDVSRAFLYADLNGDGSKEMVALNDLIDPGSGWNLRTAWAINDSGQICGTGYFNGDKRAYRFTPGYTDEDGQVVPPLNLGTLPGGTGSVAYSINDSGEVTGVSHDANGIVRAFVYTDADGDGTEEMVDIGDLGGGWAVALGINNSGQVTGSSRKLLADSTVTRAFRYTPGVDGLPGVMQDLGDLGTKWLGGSSGGDINDNGDVAGSAGSVKVRHLLCRHAALSPHPDEGGMTDLGTLGGPSSRASGINWSGEIVGAAEESWGGPYHGFLYTNKTDTGEFVMAKLEGLIERVDGVPADYQGGPIRAEKINDDGQICGSADGEAFLLTPVVDP